MSSRSNRAAGSTGGSRRAVPPTRAEKAAERAANKAAAQKSTERTDRSDRAERNRPHPVDRIREINAMPDPDPFGGRPPIESIEIRQKTYVTATEVAPLDVTGVRTVGVGVVLWLVAFAALLPFYSTLQDNDRGWWMWTCLAGFGLGLLGLEYCRRRRNRMAALPADEREVETSPLGAAGL